MKLMEPFEYQCIYIPYLPWEMHQVIYAVTPFIIGVERKDFKRIQKLIDLGNKLIVDIDSNQIFNLDNVINDMHLQIDFICNALEKKVKKYVDNEDYKQDFELMNEIKV